MSEYVPKSPAHHESAHAVVSKALGSPKARIWLGDDDGVNARYEGGRCRDSLPLPAPGREDIPALRNMLVMLMAGRIAERIAAGFPPTVGEPAEDAMGLLILERAPGYRRDGTVAWNAYKWALEELAEMVDDDELQARYLWDRLGPDALRRAVDLVRKHWATIESLAARVEVEREVLL